MPTVPFLDLTRRGWLAPMLEVGRLAIPYYRVVFRGAGLRSGILRHLVASPSTPDELTAALGFRPDMVDGLTAWLDAGVTIGELSCTDGRYAIRRRSLTRLLTTANDPVAGFTEEMATLQHRLLLETPDRLLTGERLAVSDADPATIARNSRLGEPWIRQALERHVPKGRDAHLLEVGCGSGAHIRTALSLNPHLTALAVELQEPAAALARANIEQWGLGDRVQVVAGDIRDRTPEPVADLVTLHQNIYYFTESEQVELLRHVAGFLKPGGTLLVTTIVRGAGPSSATLDLWGAMTRGTSRLPLPDQLVARMRDAGFADARSEWLGNEKLYCAFLGTSSPTAMSASSAIHSGPNRA